MRQHTASKTDTAGQRTGPRYQSGQAPLPCRTVLVVDDEPDIRDLVALMLKSRAVNVLLAGDGREGVETLREHHDDVDVVLLDLTMPGSPDPVTTLSKIKAVSPRVSVILMSGYAKDLELSAQEHGFAAFLAKPFRPQALYDALRSLPSPGKEDETS